MKRHFLKFIPGLLLLVFFTLSSSCVINTNKPPKPRHKERIVWVSGVSYRQVYYMKNNKVVIVSQKEETPKQPRQKKKHHNSGKHND